MSTEEIKSFINNISKDDYTHDELIDLFILSRGNDKGEIYDDDNNILEIIGLKTNWILNHFMENLNWSSFKHAEKKIGKLLKRKMKVKLIVKSKHKSNTFVYNCTNSG